MSELSGENQELLPSRSGGVDDKDKKTSQRSLETIEGGFKREGISLDTDLLTLIEALRKLDVTTLRRLHRLAIPLDIGDEEGCVGIYRSDVVGGLLLKDVNDEKSKVIPLFDDDQKLVIHVVPFGMQNTHAMIGRKGVLRDEAMLCCALDFKNVITRYKGDPEMPSICDGLTNIEFARLMVNHFGFHPTRTQVVSNAGVELVGPTVEELREIYSAPSIDQINSEYLTQKFEIFAFTSELFSESRLALVDRLIRFYSLRVQSKHDIAKDDRVFELAEKTARAHVIVECIELNKDRL